MMKFCKLTLVLSGVMLMSACGSSSSGGSTPPVVNPGIGDLTLAFYNNLTTSTAASNIIVDFTLGTADPLKTNAHYDNNNAQHNLHTVVTEGTSTVVLNVTNSANASSVASKPAAVESGQHYTVVALGDADNSTTDVIAIKQNRTAPESGSSNIRFIHTLSNLNTTLLDVNLNAENTNIATDLDFKLASDYVVITPPASAGDKVTFDLVQSGTVVGSGDCLIRSDINYEAVIGYSDFNSTEPAVFCHPQ